MSTDSPSPAPGIALVLGGGGARGLAHLGVLEVLEREQIPVAALAGASMGGLIGTLWIAGVPLADVGEELRRLSEPLELLKLVDLVISRNGVSVRGVKIYDLLTEMLGGELRFEDLPVPLALTAADLASGRTMLLRHGPLAEAMRATVSLPGLFQPFEHDGLRLIDGGILDNLPVEAARALSPRPVVAVDVLPRFRANAPGAEPVAPPLEPEHVPQFLQELAHVAVMMVAEMTELRLAASPADLVLRPEIPTDVSLLTSFHRVDDLLLAGAAAAEAALPRLKELAGSS
ncbi:MAG TPA: patatin-like phospholipase family protein [Thermoanaerobaculia bacterium]|nr:patatin-like phospholipase family protein [Thermoanaerobaculia bacterium]